MRPAPRRRGARLSIVDASSAGLPDERRDYLREAEAALVARGFFPATYVESDSVPSTKIRVALVEHPKDGAIGAIMVTVPATRPFKEMATFETRFADGRRISTSNSATTLRTPSLPWVDGARFLGVRDVGTLYEIHQARVAEQARSTPVVPVSREHDPIGFQDREAREVQDFWVAKGYYRYVGDAWIQRTPLGAALSAWRGLFPWTMCTSLMLDRKTRRIVERLGLRANIPGM
jgi:hypothetical protein